jgi:acyl-CoA thioester hydrolase
MKEYEYACKNRYAETDQMGFYHGNMLSILRWDAWNGLETLGFPYKWMEENGIMLPVVSLNINYKTSPL